LEVGKVWGTPIFRRPMLREVELGEEEEGGWGRRRRGGRKEKEVIGGRRRRRRRRRRIRGRGRKSGGILLPLR